MAGIGTDRRLRQCSTTQWRRSRRSADAAGTATT